jgi:hypothetical protein
MILSAQLLALSSLGKLIGSVLLDYKYRCFMLHHDHTILLEGIQCFLYQTRLKRLLSQIMTQTILRLLS